MATTLALAMRASMSASGVVSGANDAAKAMDKMGRHAQQAAQDMSVLKNIAIGEVVAKGVTMVADAFMSAARAASSYVASVSTAIDQTSDLAQRIGMGVESLQALQMAAKLSGIDDATGALQKLTVAIGNAAESGDTKAFEQLGISFEALEAMSPEEQFRAVQSAIAALPTVTQRAAAAVSVFGKSGVELLPLMSQNLEEIDARMRRLGAIVGTDQVEAIGSMNDALDMVQATFDGIIGNVVGNLAPVVESLANDLLSFVESFNTANGTGGQGIATTISEALLDVAEYLAAVLDQAVAGFDDFGVTMQQVGDVFQFVADYFIMISENLRVIFNAFEVYVNTLGIVFGTFLEKLGSVFSSSVQQFGKELADSSFQAQQKNQEELAGALSNSFAATTRMFIGGELDVASEGPFGQAVRNARERMTPESQAERASARKAAEAEAQAARTAAAADAKAKREAEAAKAKRDAESEKAKREAEAAQKRKEDKDRKLAELNERLLAKNAEAGQIVFEKRAALNSRSNESLRANDIRSSEGMAQFMALAMGRQDPAIEENRKTNAKLEEIRKELNALRQQEVDILGAAA